MKIYSFLELHVTCLCTYLQKKKNELFTFMSTIRDGQNFNN